MTQLSVAKLRSQTIAALKNKLDPLMYDSGFRVGKVGSSRPMKLWSPKARPVIFEEGMALTEFWGWSEQGVITDAYGGGCITESLSSIPLEDLMMLQTWVEENV